MSTRTIICHGQVPWIYLWENMPKGRGKRLTFNKGTIASKLQKTNVCVTCTRCPGLGDLNVMRQCGLAERGRYRGADQGSKSRAAGRYYSPPGEGLKITDESCIPFELSSPSLIRSLQLSSRFFLSHPDSLAVFPSLSALIVSHQIYASLFCLSQLFPVSLYPSPSLLIHPLLFLWIPNCLS